MVYIQFACGQSRLKMIQLLRPFILKDTKWAVPAISFFPVRGGTDRGRGQCQGATRSRLARLYLSLGTVAHH